jgi:agmatine deiminase
VLRRAFPGRQIVPLDAMAINLGGGGMHCITQQEPAMH